MRESAFVVGISTWRTGILTSLMVAAKVVFDEKVTLDECREQLPKINLDRAHELEASFLSMLSYRTVVRRAQYARYYYALQDVVLTYERLCSKCTPPVTA